jgi:hypothetical protein
VGGKTNLRRSVAAGLHAPSGPSRGDHSAPIAAMLAGFIVVWAAANLAAGGEGFAKLAPEKVVGVRRRPRRWLASSPPWCSACSWRTP